MSSIATPIKPGLFIPSNGKPAVISRGAWIERKDPRMAELVRSFNPKTDLMKFIRSHLDRFTYEEACELVEMCTRIVVVESELQLMHYSGATGKWLDYGVVCRRQVTNNGVAAIVDAFQNAVEIELFNYHGIGTGTNAEAAADSALQTELTTEYTGNIRATGTQTESASNAYRTTATNTLDSGTPAVTEHGILTQAATGGGTLLDRSVFSAINLVGASGDALQSQYTITFTAGG